MNLEPEDLVALTVEAAAMAQVPLAGTGWIRARAVLGSVGTKRAKADDDRSGQGLEDQGIKYFLISFVDLLGVLRAKLVPAPPSARCRKPAPASRASPPGST